MVAGNEHQAGRVKGKLPRRWHARSIDRFVGPAATEGDRRRLIGADFAVKFNGAIFPSVCAAGL